VSSVRQRRERLGRARLYLVIDAAPAERVLAAALEGGVDVVQLREKSAFDNAVVEAGRRMRALCDEHGALLVVNDRPDLAVECGADGVHIGQGDEPLDRAREMVGPDMLIGISTHSPEQIDAALSSPADYLGVGPVYATATKPGVEPVGLGLVRYAAQNGGAKPWFAIGGIESGNVAAVAEAGASRIAVVRAIRDAADPRAAAAALRSELVREGAHA
jgi:thiamine-phosphate pyrophosphorylase